MGHDSWSHSAGAVAERTAGDRGERHDCRGDATAVDSATKELVDVMKRFFLFLDELG